MKFNVKVIRTDEYEIEIDENKFNEEALKSWSEVFSDVETQEDLAKKLAGAIMYFGSDYGFIEGFGYVKTVNENGNEVKHYEQGHGVVLDSEYSSGLSVKIIYENEDYDYESEEIK